MLVHGSFALFVLRVLRGFVIQDEHAYASEIPHRYHTGYSIGSMPVYETEVETHYRCQRCVSRINRTAWVIATPIAVLDLMYILAPGSAANEDSWFWFLLFLGLASLPLPLAAILRSQWKPVSSSYEK